MKFFLDENISPSLSASLESLFKAHRFRSSERENLQGVLDVDLFHELKERDFGAIITLDAQQLELPDERNGLRHAGLHWVGMANPPGTGLEVLGGLAATIMAGLPHVLDDWRTKPHLYRLGGQIVSASRPIVEPL